MTPQKKLEQHYDTLTPELQRAAELILQHVNEMVALSMRAVAKRIGVNPPTLLRLAQRLGEFKTAFIEALGLSHETHQAEPKSWWIKAVRHLSIRTCLTPMR